MLQAVARQEDLTYPVHRMSKSRTERGRKVVLPAFGAALQAARGNWEEGVVIQRVKEYTPALTKLDQSRLEFYEAGAVLSPDPLLLLALSVIYGVNLMDWMRLLKWNRENLGSSQAPEAVATIGEGDMRLSALDRDWVKRLHNLPQDAQERVLHNLRMEETMATTVQAGPSLQKGTFRKRRR